LAISSPGDHHEQEADRVADQVMRMPDPEVRRQYANASARNSSDEKEPQIKRYANGEHGSGEVASDFTSSLGAGVPLDAASRNYFEPRFSHDFGHVRVHTDERAVESARLVNALAFTVGRDIVFGSGQYAPGSHAGRRLLAHELTHVIQQGSNRDSGVVQREAPDAGEQSPAGQPVATTDAGAADAGAPDAGAPDAGAAQAAPEQTAPQRICGPDITTSLTTMLGTVEPWFRGLTGFQQSRSCAGLGPAGFAVGVNPVMAWDTRELFLPDTGWLDAHFRSASCGSPRDPGCAADATRHLCETDGSCGNSVVVGGKCLLAGTANYALFGKMCRVCHDLTGRWNRWDMRAIIGAYKTVALDDSTPPKEVATAAYDGTFPTLPAAAENRGTCTGRCGVTHSGAFDFIWEPYRSR
jgi:hypothetical protein